MKAALIDALRRPLFLCAALLALSACGNTPTAHQSSMNFASATQSHASMRDEARVMGAVQIAQTMRSKGQRVWCVPFARNASGVNIRGNAGTWWRKTGSLYRQSHTPIPGSVMVFKSTRSMPMGHVAVVSKQISPRKILIDHANWKRNQVSLGMEVIDVSEKNDWSAVRVKSTPAAYGSVYPVHGFIAAARG